MIRCVLTEQIRLDKFRYISRLPVPKTDRELLLSITAQKVQIGSCVSIYAKIVSVIMLKKCYLCSGIWEILPCNAK